jgi:periplasmic protein TonB
MKTLIVSTPYGYQELRQIHHRYMMLAMLMAITIHIMILGGYHLSKWLKPDAQDAAKGSIHVQIPFNLLPLPPSITNPMPNIAAPVVPSKLSVGIPIPIPDYQVNPEREFTTHPDVLNTPNISGIGGDGNVIVIPPDPNDPSPDIFQPIEKEPIPVFTIAPQYPDVPLRAGLEGNVVLKVLLTKEGKVKKAILVQSDDNLFVQPAIDAALKWAFTPAVMNGKPVAVWVSIPFRFRLTGK